MKKLIAFDLDGTLAESKSPLPDRMAELLNSLLEKKEVCVISGGKFEQFEKQLLDNLKADSDNLKHLHIMPTCGTRYYRYDSSSNKWNKLYAENFTAAEKKKIIAALQESIADCGFDKEETWGEQVEDRESQITFSALGQQAPVDAKEAWDPSGDKKLKIRNRVAELIPDFEVRTGGATSIDVTKLGIDKAYGMRKLIELTGIKKEEILFMGDRLKEGGNDYPVKAMGIDSIEVSHWQDTALVIQAIVLSS
jgi:HAD superfamily hydrolase (TIGR01484 family)